MKSTESKIILRPLSLDDLDTMVELTNDPDVTLFIPGMRDWNNAVSNVLAYRVWDRGCQTADSISRGTEVKDVDGDNIADECVVYQAFTEDGIPRNSDRLDGG